MPLAPKRKGSRPPATEPELFDYAVRALGSRMLTASELRRRLQRRVEPGDSGAHKIAAVLARLTELRYLDDTRYAADFTRLRQENEHFGARRVRQDLALKGLPPKLIDQTITSAYQDVSEIELARRYIQRKRIPAPTDQKETARVMRRLLQAGFSSSAVFSVLRSWAPEQASEAEALAAQLLDDSPEAEP